MNFCWTTLQVSDLDKSLSFYRDLLGIPVVSIFSVGPVNIAFLGRESGAQIELIRTPEGCPADAGKGVSVGFMTKDPDALAARLREAGCTVNGPISPKPDVSFYFVSDPDGYQVQLCKESVLF